MSRSECCKNKQIAKVTAKCSDMCYVAYPNDTDSDNNGVPYDLNIGGGDYIRLEFCMNCGMIQGKFPVESPKSELDEED